MHTRFSVTMLIGGSILFFGVLPSSCKITQSKKHDSSVPRTGLVELEKVDPQRLDLHGKEVYISPIGGICVFDFSGWNESEDYIRYEMGSESGTLILGDRILPIGYENFRDIKIQLCVHKERNPSGDKDLCGSVSQPITVPTGDTCENKQWQEYIEREKALLASIQDVANRFFMSVKQHAGSDEFSEESCSEDLARHLNFSRDDLVNLSSLNPHFFAVGFMQSLMNLPEEERLELTGFGLVEGGGAAAETVTVASLENKHIKGELRIDEGLSPWQRGIMENWLGSAPDVRQRALGAIGMTGKPDDKVFIKRLVVIKEGSEVAVELARVFPPPLPTRPPMIPSKPGPVLEPPDLRVQLAEIKGQLDAAFMKLRSIPILAPIPNADPPQIPPPVPIKPILIDAPILEPVVLRVFEIQTIETREDVEVRRRFDTEWKRQVLTGIADLSSGDALSKVQMDALQAQLGKKPFEARNLANFDLQQLGLRNDQLVVLKRGLGIKIKTAGEGSSQIWSTLTTETTEVKAFDAAFQAKLAKNPKKKILFANAVAWQRVDQAQPLKPSPSKKARIAQVEELWLREIRVETTVRTRQVVREVPGPSARGVVAAGAGAASATVRPRLHLTEGESCPAALSFSQELLSIQLESLELRLQRVNNDISRQEKIANKEEET